MAHLPPHVSLLQSRLRTVKNVTMRYCHLNFTLLKLAVCLKYHDGEIMSFRYSEKNSAAAAAATTRQLPRFGNRKGSLVPDPARVQGWNMPCRNLASVSTQFHTVVTVTWNVHVKDWASLQLTYNLEIITSIHNEFLLSFPTAIAAL